ncbi:hypothetical protein OJ998_28035 [Solirubrobacter taibaiensis]|nr:hypothetical protein [Solirubrobacter taibaiensis]
MSALAALDALVSEHLHPALKAHGLRRRGRTWWVLAGSRRVAARDVGDRRRAREQVHPDVALNAPLTTDRTWRLRPGVEDEVVAYAVDEALPLARAHLDVDAALHALRERPEPWLPLAPVWSLIYACGMLERVAPEHPEREAVVAELDALWTADPRPDFLKPVLERWRA